MKEKLIIQNFGPIKSVELELSRFNVFIGEQGTGKSTVAKVLAVCRYFSYILNGYSIYDPFLDGLLFYGLTNSIKVDSYISYDCEDYFFEVKRTSPDYPPFVSSLIPKSDKFKNLIFELEKIVIRPIPAKDNYPVQGWKIPYSFFQNDVSRVMNNPFYMPTERGLQSFFSLGKNPDLTDALFYQFSKIKRIADDTSFNDILIEPLNIVYQIENGYGRVKKNNEEVFVPLKFAASGYQSTIPVVLLMEYYISIRKKAKTFIIEEPELNLFPSAQKELMQYLVDKTMNYGNTMLLTTHSPYVLASLNTMLAAYKSGLVDKEATNKVIPEKYWLSPDEISVYELLSDGTCEDIVDREERLIKAEKIDVISNTLNEQFEALLNIEFSER